MQRQPRPRPWIVGLGILELALGCTRHAEETNRPRTVASALVIGSTPSPASLSSRFAVDNSFPGEREPHVRKGSEPTELLADATSAYAAGLAVDADAIYLLTDRVVHRIVPGASPQQIPVDHGGTAAATRTDIVYWSKGAIWRVPNRGGKARRLAAVEHQPQSFLAAGDDFAWLDMPVRDQFLIQTLDGHRVRTLLSYAGRIETATMDAGRVFFVRRDDESSWRIGSISTRGGEPTYAAPKTGPTPAKLAVAGDVFYYDLKSDELRRLPADLSREETLTTGLVCSPAAVSVRIYCPSVQGMFELARHLGAKPMPLFPSPRRITAVAASSSFLVWLEDAGADRLSLQMIRLVLDDVE